MVDELRELEATVEPMGRRGETESWPKRPDVEPEGQDFRVEWNGILEGIQCLIIFQFLILISQTHKTHLIIIVDNDSSRTLLKDLWVEHNAN